MKRFLVSALVGAWSLAGSTGLAFGANDGPQPGSKPQATKASPTPAPGKRPPSTPQPQAKKPAPPPPKKQPPSKPPDHRKVVVDVPKGGPKPPAKKDPTKPGQAKPDNGSKSGTDSYSWADYKRDLDKGVKEQQDGLKEEGPADLQILGGAVLGLTAGPLGPAVGATGEAIINGPQLVDGKLLQAKGTWDGVVATGKLIGSWLNGTFK
jgi:hypothetical protein